MTARASSAERIPFEGLPPDLRSLLEPRVRRLGYLGEFFQVAAHQPAALSAFVSFSEALKDALPWRLVEVIALTVSARTGNAYERVQHERLALTLGMRVEEARALASGGPLGQLESLSPAERAAVGLADAMVSAHGHGADGPFRRLQELIGIEAAVGCAMLAGRYVAHAAMANCWLLEPPVSSLLEGDDD